MSTNAQDGPAVLKRPQFPAAATPEQRRQLHLNTSDFRERFQEIFHMALVNGFKYQVGVRSPLTHRIRANPTASGSRQLRSEG